MMEMLCRESTQQLGEEPEEIRKPQVHMGLNTEPIWEWTVYRLDYTVHRFCYPMGGRESEMGRELSLGRITVLPL